MWTPDLLGPLLTHGCLMAPHPAVLARWRARRRDAAAEGEAAARLLLARAGRPAAKDQLSGDQEGDVGKRRRGFETGDKTGHER